MIYLRQSTASQEILLGRFLDSTDGNTEETGLTIANTDIKLWKTGATTLANKNSGGATHISNGLYYAVLDATDTDTIGPMRIDVHVSGALAVVAHCVVLDEAVYDVLFGTTAPSTLAAGALMGLADDAITAAKISAGAIGSSEAPLLSHLDADISSRLAASGYTAPDNASITAILEDTGTTLPAAIAALPTDADVNAACDTAIADAALATASALATVDGVVDAILLDTAAIDARLPSDPADESLLEAAIATRSAAGDAMALTAGAVDAIWDEVLTGATHNVASSAGRRLRQLASVVIYDGFIVSSTANTAVLDAGASSNNGAYDPGIIVIVNGTGAGQSRLVLEYIGASKTAVIDRDWKVNPDETSEFVIFAAEGREHINEGRAQGGTATSITLNSAASSADDEYVGQVVFIRSGSGQDQARRITAYNGTTKVATVYGDWTVNPDATSGYVMLPSGVISEGMIGDSVADEVVEGSTTLRQSLRLMMSALLGKVSGAPTGPIVFRDLADSKDRITATVDEDGNRTSVTRDAT